MLETVNNLLQDGLVEHQLFALHNGHHVATCQQLTGLENDAVGSCIEHVDPQLLVEDFASKDEDAYLRVQLLGLTAQLNADGSATS